MTSALGAAMARTGSERAATVGEIKLGDLAAPIAIHDMRAPLVGMVGLTEQLLTTDLDDRQRNDIVALAEAARHALAMANDLADIVRSKAGVLTIVSKPADLRAICLAGATLSGNRARHKGLEFHLDAGPPPGPVVMTDARRLSQIIANLLDNAVKYTVEGSVGLSVQYATVNGRAGVTIEISDTGPGIPEDQQSQLLEPYRRGEQGRSQRGLGLGLYVTRTMVDALGGALRFEPAAGGGTRVIVDLDLPLAEAPQPPQPVVARETPAAPDGSPGSVLVVDDNAVNLQLMETILRQFGHEVTLAKSGKDALALLATSTFDVVLMDYEMPEMNGVETAIAIRAMPDHTDTPILALSAHRGGLPSDAPSDLYDAVLEKPIRIPALQQALSAATHAAKRPTDIPSAIATAI